MHKILLAMTGLAMAMVSGAASAAEVKGTITMVNQQARTVTINGVAYTFPQAVNMAGLIAGQTVTLTYETANNVNTVSKVAK